MHLNDRDRDRDRDRGGRDRGGVLGAQVFDARERLSRAVRCPEAAL